MFEILIAAIIGYILIIELIVLVEREVSFRSAVYAFLYMLLLFAAAAANFELEIFDQKFAAEFAYDVFKGRESLRGNSTFILQAIVGYPAFLVTDVWWAAIGTNIAVTTGVFYFVHKRSPVLSCAMLAPAIINFSMFSLRDPVIAVLAFAVCYLFFTPNSPLLWLKQSLTVGLFIVIRPENLAIFGYSKLLTVFNKHNRSALLYLAFPFLILVGVVITAFTPQMLGVEFGGSLSQLPGAANELYESRATRWDETEGGGSNILGGALPGLPIFIRFPIQVFTFFVLPLPFEIRKPSLALAFLDSIVFCYLYYRFHRNAQRDALIVFWVYVFAVAFFGNNYGNVFRLRLPAYFIMLAGLLRK